MAAPSSELSELNIANASSAAVMTNTMAASPSSSSKLPVTGQEDVKTKSDMPTTGGSTAIVTADSSSATAVVGGSTSQQSDSQVKPKLVIFAFGGAHTDPAHFLTLPKYIQKCKKEKINFVIGVECNLQITSAELKKKIERIEKEEPIRAWLVEHGYVIGKEVEFDFIGKAPLFSEFINKNNTLSSKDKKWWIEKYRVEAECGKTKNDKDHRPFSCRVRENCYAYIRKIAYKVKSDFVFQLEKEKIKLYALDEGVDPNVFEASTLRRCYNKKDEDVRISNMARNIRKMIDENFNNNGGIIFLFNLGLTHLNRLCARLNLQLKYYVIEIHPIQLLSIGEIVKTRYGEEKQKNLADPRNMKIADELSKVDDEFTKQYAINNPIKKIPFSQDPTLNIICTDLDALIDKTIKASIEHEELRRLLIQKLTYQQIFINNVTFIIDDWSTRFLPNTLEYQTIQELANGIKSLSNGDDVFRFLQKMLKPPKILLSPEQLKSLKSTLIQCMKKYNEDKSIANKAAEAPSGATPKPEGLHTKEDGKDLVSNSMGNIPNPVVRFQAVVASFDAAPPAAGPAGAGSKPEDALTFSQAISPASDSLASQTVTVSQLENPNKPSA